MMGQMFRLVPVLFYLTCMNFSALTLISLRHMEQKVDFSCRKSAKKFVNQTGNIKLPAVESNGAFKKR